MLREPVVSGQFYPDKEADLEKMIKNCYEHEYGPGNIGKIEPNEKIFGVVCPHAGYAYSGPTACHSYKSISSQKIELAIILGPNHFGVGKDVATMKDSSWSTPLGTVEVDSESAQEIVENSGVIEFDNYSHSKDHSLEVQIPMLQTIYSEFKILPIILRAQDLYTTQDVGNAISKITKKKNSIIIASSDFTHYEENSFAYLQDKAAIEPILKMDVDAFYHTIKEKQITACGFGAIASAMVACKNLGATKGKLLSYTTSGDISGDTSSVVGYGAIKFI